MSLPTTAATGTTGQAMELLAASLSASESWQAVCGVDEEDDPAAEALAYIWFEEITLDRDEDGSDPDSNVPFPRAVITDGGLRDRLIATGDTFGASGRLQMLLMLRTESAVSHNHPEAYIRAVNVIDAVIADIRAVSGTAGYLAISEIQREQVMRSEPSNDTPSGADVFMAFCTIMWEGTP
jgi:hypothetical protein